MKFIVQGIGSIGQRHYRNLLALGHDVAILRSSNSMRPFVKEFFDSEESRGNSPQVFYSPEDAFTQFSPDALIVATPNHLHLESIAHGLKYKTHLFIEKPIHHVLREAEEIKKAVAESNLVVAVGYNLRFHPLLKRVKEMIDQGDLGTLLSAAVEVGEDIRDWHPWEDYRDTYAPHSASGGGALLCFSHDIDYVYWLLGTPEEIYSAGGKVTPLEGDAEDMVQSLWKYPKGLSVTLHIDYYQRPKTRTLKIVGSEKTVLWDAYAGTLQIWEHESGNESVERVPPGFERNSMFIDELKDFVVSIAHGHTPVVPFNDGVAVLGIIEEMKKSLVKSI